MTSAEALKALEEADFEWAVHLNSVWTDINYDIPAIHGNQRDAILSRISSLARSKDTLSPLGLVIRGNAGAGKTHMLSAVRRSVLSKDQVFILVDMTDVREFWDTVNQGYLTSLEQNTPTGETQLSLILKGVLRYANVQLSLSQISDCSHPSWTENLNLLLRGLAQRERLATRRFADIVRAVCLLCSDDFEVSGIAYNWLLAIPLDEQEFKHLKFTRLCSSPMEVVEGLSWLIGLSTCTVLALDQLDSIVTQHSLVSAVEQSESDERKFSQATIEGIGGGLSALRDKTSRTLTIVTCIEKTWERLTSLALSSFIDRFEASPVFLANIYDQKSTSAMVESRLHPAYQKYGIDPPYRSWPFAPEFFSSTEGMLPRQLLKQCDRHRRKCLELGVITELTSIEEAPVSHTELHQLDRDYEQLIATSSSPEVLNEKNEDGIFASLIRFAFIGLALEQDISEAISNDVDTEFTGGWRTRPLHARIRQILRTNQDDERHLSVRVLQTDNARAFNNRIRLAMGASGIGKGLKHRHLLIIRNSPPPKGPSSQKLSHEFRVAGGEFVAIQDQDILRLKALRELRDRNPAEFEAWQVHRKPISQLSFLDSAVAWLDQHSERIQPRAQFENSVLKPDSLAAEFPTSDTKPPTDALHPFLLPSGFADIEDSLIYGREELPSANSPQAPHREIDSQYKVTSKFKNRIPLGVQLIGQHEGPCVTIAIEDFSRHAVILAGSGSGKTVLIRRLVEETSLLGIPSVVIDGANDLARLGDRWNQSPANWTIDDERKARLYHQNSEVIIWTPGRESGNPLQLRPLPNFNEIGDPEELDQATDMARDSLQDIVAQGHSQSAFLKRGILKVALTYYASTLGQGEIGDFIALLRDLPPEACEGIDTAAKKAQEMAGALWAEVQNNPLLRQSGHTLDPGILFGTGSIGDKTRISVINLSGLQGLSAQQQFLNQLFMTLFIWIKKNPPHPETPIRGLLVLDEAKDFVPSNESTACKSSFIRLVAQARKYGLGIVVATQSPKSIDHNVIANCSTQLFGKANSPAAIAVVGQAISQRGGNPDQVSRLKTGQFYISSESVNPPLKITTPLCLSYHPSSPLSEEEVIQKATFARLALASS